MVSSFRDLRGRIEVHVDVTEWLACVELAKFGEIIGLEKRDVIRDSRGDYERRGQKLGLITSVKFKLGF